MRLILADDGKLHPALFSAEAEHKVGSSTCLLSVISAVTDKLLSIVFGRHTSHICVISQ